MSEVYLDNAATTWMDPGVMDAIDRIRSGKFGNSSSIHRLGVRSALEAEKARMVVASVCGAHSDEIVFTSGGTESNNLALQGFCIANRSKGNHVITSNIEHSSLAEVTRWLETQDFRISRLSVDNEGFCDPDELIRLIDKKTILVSLIHGNNEVGTLQDLEIFGSVCAERGVAFHTDACQSFTKKKIDVKKMNLDLISFSAHKIHGPAGVGALFVKHGTRLEPLLRGGGQERGLRPGTLNLEGIVGFSAAVQNQTEDDVKRMAEMRDSVINQILSAFPQATLNGPSGSKRLCNNINVTFDRTSSKKLLFDLDRKGIAISAGSACSSGSKSPSPVLLAMGRTVESAHNSIRISISKWTTRDDGDRLVKALKEVL